MKKKEFKFMKKKLLELSNNNIISKNQYEEAIKFFNNDRKNFSLSMIFSSIGIFLIALSCITFFAINWNNIGKTLKVIISFIPLVITSIMLYYYVKKENKNLGIYTSIIAPISILATNSLIGQIFHIQSETYELIFCSLLMYLPIVFILKNKMSLLIYGIGIFYNSILIEELKIFSYQIILLIPLVIYNLYLYKNDKSNKNNILLWIINITNLTLIFIVNEILRTDVFFLYLYTISILTKILFKEETTLNKFISALFICYLMISCMSPIIVSYIDEIEYKIDTLIISIILLIFLYISKEYKNPKELFILAFIIISQCSFLRKEIAYILISILTLIYGIYKIINGNKINSYKSVRNGILIIIYLIMIRFISSNISFMAKSILFLVSGILFMIAPKIVKKKIGGREE